jgi:general secretion pathway protein F/type IV pilus assembly protein PilC
MPLFYYRAINPSGKKQKGFIEAFNERDAKQKLREQGVFVTQLTTKSSLLSSQNLKGENLYNFTTLLTQLISSGIPLYESLIAIEEQYRGTTTHRVILSLAEQVKGGARLSQAMASFPESFDNLYCAMVAAGESSGSLDTVLEKLSVLLRKRLHLKKEINTALIYPAILATFAMIVVGVLLGFVIPSIEGIFAERKLNKFTQFVISLSHFARDWWWVYIPLVIGSILIAYFQLKKPGPQLWMLKNMVRLPLIGKVMIEAAMSRFCRTLATLTTGGLPLIEGIRLSKGTLQNPMLETDIENAEKKIIEGSHLSQELAKSRYIPQLVPRMLAIGEETGHLPVMLNKVADIYEDELDKTLKRTLALMQPIILIVMGVIIGTVLIAILLPLTDLSSLS